MRSHERRVEKLEDKTLNPKEDAPDNLSDIYALEDDPESDIGKALQAMYNPNKSFTS